MSCDDSSLFRWATRRQTIISFTNLSIISLWRPFEDDFSVCYMLHYSVAYFGYMRGVRLQCLRATACYNYADNFLHLCTETHESHTCLTLAKNSSVMEEF